MRRLAELWGIILGAIVGVAAGVFFVPDVTIEFVGYGLKTFPGYIFSGLLLALIGERIGLAFSSERDTHKLELILTLSGIIFTGGIACLAMSCFDLSVIVRIGSWKTDSRLFTSSSCCGRCFRCCTDPYV